MSKWRDEVAGIVHREQLDRKARMEKMTREQLIKTAMNPVSHAPDAFMAEQLLDEQDALANFNLSKGE